MSYLKSKISYFIKNIMLLNKSKNQLKALLIALKSILSMF